MKTWLKILIIVLILVVFLFPKPAGKSGRGLPSQSVEDSWTDKKCSCIGYKFDGSPDLADAPHSYFCVGIPYSCKCIEYTYNRETKEKTSKQIIC